MRNLFFASFVSVFTFLFSCNHIDETEVSNAKILERDFLESTITMERSNRIQIINIQSKASEFSTREKGIYWLAKAETIKKYIDSVRAYIESLRMQLKNEANLHLEEGKEVFNENSKSPVHKIFITDNKSELLLFSWATLNSRLMNIDKGITKEFENMFEKIKIEGNKIEKETLNNFKKRFTNITTMEALVILSSTENKIVNKENQLMFYCNSQMGVLEHCGFSKSTKFLVGQNTTKLQKGDQIIISAGIAEYTSAGAPKIKINNKNIELEQGGAAEYKIIITTSPGKYKIPVTVDFTDESGYKKNFSQIVEYEVVK